MEAMGSPATTITRREWTVLLQEVVEVGIILMHALYHEGRGGLTAQSRPSILASADLNAS